MYVSGHNLKRLKRTAQHRRRIGEAQRRAWQTKRQRLPIGTRRFDHSGYVVVKVLAGKGAWKLEHVIVMERLLGRRLRPSEVIHHVNGDRADNAEANLYLCRDRSHHNDVHRSEASALRVLFQRGIVTFKDGRYEAVLRPD